MLSLVADFKGLGINYTGLKSHEAAILKYANKGQRAKWEARQVEAVVRALLKLKA